MRILTRYILKELAGPTLIAMGLYTFLLVMNWCVLLTDYAFKYKIPLTDMGYLMLLQLPHIVVLTVPMGFLVGVLVATARLSGENELLAMRSSGVHPVAMLRPVLWAGGVLALLNGFLLAEVTPRGNQASTVRMTELYHDNILRVVQPRQFNNSYPIPGVILYVEQIARDAQGDVWKGVLLEWPVPGSGRREVLLADEARPVFNQDGSGLALAMPRVEVHSFDPSGTTDYEWRTSEDTLFPVPLPPILARRSEQRGQKHYRNSTLAELFERVELTRGENEFSFNTAVLEIHKRFSIPFAAVVFALLGLGLGQQVRKGGTAFGYVVGLAIFMAYYLLFYAGERLAAEGQLSPWLSMWIGNIVFGLLALVIFGHRATDGKLLHRLMQLGPVQALQRTLHRSTLGLIRLAGQFKARREAAGGGLRFVSFRFPRIVDRYLGREFLKVLSLVLLSGFGIFVLVTVFQLLEDILRNKIETRVVLELYWSWLPEILTYVLPLATLVATLVSLGGLSRSNEITALKVHGISLYRAAVPLLGIGLALTLFGFYLYGLWLPTASQRYQELYDQVRGITRIPPMSAVRWAGGITGREFYRYDAYDLERGSFHRMSIFRLAPDAFHVTSRVHAARALWGEPGHLELERGWEMGFEDGKEEYRTFEARVIPFSEPRSAFDRQWKPTPKYMTYDELQAFVAYRVSRGLPVRTESIELHNKRAFPFTALVMILLGYPFAFLLGSRGSLYGIGLAILLGGAYWTSFILSAFLGKVGVLPPLVAAWAPNVAFSLAGIYLFLGLDT